MRIDKFLCLVTNHTRSEVKDLIKKKRINVNDEIIKDPGLKIDENKDRISLDGKILTYSQFHYFMLNKPEGVVSATVDIDCKTVIDLFKEENIKDLSPVGRLDKDTVGLLIVTNDGELIHHLTSPRHHVKKTYSVKLAHALSKEDINKLETGIDLKEDGITKPCKIDLLDDDKCLVNITISEGKYHQVKRMFKAVSNEVLFLKRLSMGCLRLDESLGYGQYRRLSEEEIEFLRK